MANTSADSIASHMGIDTRPSVHLSVKEIPQLKSWKVGQTYKVMMQLKQTAMQEGGYDGKQPLSGDFRIVSVNGNTSKAPKTAQYDDDEDD